MAHVTTRKGITYQEAWRCFVTSEKDDGHEYLVDLAALQVQGEDGPYKNGECDCPHFQMRLKPQITKGYNHGEPLRCKHIIRARHWFLDKAIMMDPREQETAVERFDRQSDLARHRHLAPMHRGKLQYVKNKTS